MSLFLIDRVKIKLLYNAMTSLESKFWQIIPGGDAKASSKTHSSSEEDSAFSWSIEQNRPILLNRRSLTHQQTRSASGFTHWSDFLPCNQGASEGGGKSHLSVAIWVHHAGKYREKIWYFPALSQQQSVSVTQWVLHPWEKLRYFPILSPQSVSVTQWVLHRGRNFGTSRTFP